MTKVELAKAFSNGQFEETFPHLADNITWTIVGEQEFKGKEAVIDNCKAVAAYFTTVTTDFKTLHVLADEHQVAISGTGEFFKDKQRVALVSAFDLYLFNDQEQLEEIVSYCIDVK